MRPVAFGLLLTAGLGCVHIQPVGPLAQLRGLPANPPPGGAAPADEAPEPVVRPAPKPTPPALYVTPAEVTPLTADEAIKRLGQELDTDRRTMEAMPNISEVSVIKK